MNMEKEKITVRFASEEVEEDYKSLGRSEHPEDRKLFAVLKSLREALLSHHRGGKSVPEGRIVKLARDLFGIEKLWSLDIPSHGTAFYGVVGNEILIVDHT